ncbi:MAE_28990/MAE_18760 family HEPN-like nuclease [Runella aurantiaca]|uniref:MAE-28990/MAE-18760-like HEPN domain-containing protein n=1 Tax=Runella aurantiaca TaxID=2282308 RepID=A0A369IF65_9BACT|nr:MAE_28990/MAE_18760 family HEPN-like nuclease [Runella aurantiaca]RDB07490.1 hypothetical protein DVG78_00010 [Runella aurantiaca]
MVDIKNDLEINMKHLDSYLTMLRDIEQGAKLIHNGNQRDIDSNLFKVLKANTFLFLYNLIESTIRRSIEFIHITINNESIKYQEAIDEIQKIWILYKHRNFKEHGSDRIHEIMNLIIEEVIDVEYDKFIKKNKSNDLSGNVDALKVRNLSNKYKFEENRRVAGARLVRIKSLRNNLAHGNVTFVDCGKDYVHSDLLIFKKETNLFLKEFLTKIEKYIFTKAYKRQSATNIMNSTTT